MPGDGSLWGWGSNDYGQLVPTGSARLDTPQKLEGMDWRQADTGRRHSLALSRGGQVWAWGDNGASQLGLGDSRPRSARSHVPGLPRITQVSAGALHSLALDDAGELWIWGGNLVGQLGMAPAGLFEWRAKPVRVGNLPRIRAIAAAGSRSAVRTEDGRIFVWGAGVLKPTLAIPAQAGGGLGGNDPGNWTWPVGANWRALASKLGKSPDSIDPKVAILAGRLTRSAKPVAGASVQAAGHFCAETGQDGRFLCVLPASRETILAAYEGGKQIATRTLASLPGARVTEVDLPLQIEPLTLSSHGEPDTRGVRMDVPVHAESPPAAKPGAHSGVFN